MSRGAAGHRSKEDLSRLVEGPLRAQTSLGCCCAPVLDFPTVKIVCEVLRVILFFVCLGFLSLESNRDKRGDPGW